MMSNEVETITEANMPDTMAQVPHGRNAPPAPPARTVLAPGGETQPIPVTDIGTAQAADANLAWNADSGEPDPEVISAMKKLEENRQRKKRSRIIKIAVTCGVVVAAFVLWNAFNAASTAMQTASVAPETAVVTRENLDTTVQTTGSLKPSTYVAITPEVAGVIQEVMVSEGQQVQEGDVLLTLKNSDLDRSLADAGAALDHARRAVSDAESGVSNAWDAYYEAVDSYNAAVERANEAIDNASVIADEAYIDAYNSAVALIPKSATEEEREMLLEEARASAQAAYDAAYSSATSIDPGTFDETGYLSSINAAESSSSSVQESLDDAQRAYSYALEEADKRTVRATVSGTVLDLKAVPGAAVGGATGGTSTTGDTLLHIADLSSLSVDVEVNEVDIANVAPGQRTEVTFTAIPDLVLEGSVTSVASVATNSSSSSEGGQMGGGVVTFKVTTVLGSADDRLKPGMSASVSILTKETADALVVPSMAVEEDETGSYVNVVTDESTFAAERRDVTIVDRSGSQVAISGDVSEGDTVLMSSPTIEGGPMASSSASSR